MSVLFLDPLVLSGYALVGVYSWLVWRGSLSWWFGRDAGWTVVAWPLPAVTAALPVVVSVVTGLTSLVGLGRDGGMLGTLVYLCAGLVPWFLLCAFPPRWSLPRWARNRLVTPPRLASVRSGPIGAVHAVRGRGHGSSARWVWRVDGTPGALRVDGTVLRFRSDPDADDGGGDPAAATDGDASTSSPPSSSARRSPHDAGEGTAPEVSAQDAAHPPGSPAPAGQHGVDGSTAPIPPGQDEDVLARFARELGFVTGADAAASPGARTHAEPGSAGRNVRPDAIDLVLDGSVRWRLRALRPWSGDGLLELEIDGHGSTYLWVASAVRVRRQLTAAGGAVPRAGFTSRARRAVGG